MFGTGLWSVERPKFMWRINSSGLLITLAVAGSLIAPFGVLGVAFGLLAGDCYAAVMRIATFYYQTHKNTPPQEQS